jgi:hypothetical protein
MVKNSFGGNRQKAVARKDTFVSKSKTRTASDPSEVYAKVIKLFGGKICQVITIDGITINANIRGKFSGKFKRANMISINSFVLIGLHDFNYSNPSSDILEIYDLNDIHFLLLSSSNLFFNLDFNSSSLPYSYSSSPSSTTSPSPSSINLDIQNDIHNDIQNDILINLI